MKDGTVEAAKWILGLTFGAGIAYAAVVSSTANVKELKIHLERHDSEISNIREDLSYIKAGMDILLGRKRNGK